MTEICRSKLREFCTIQPRSAPTFHRKPSHPTAQFAHSFARAYGTPIHRAKPQTNRIKTPSTDNEQSTLNTFPLTTYDLLLTPAPSSAIIELEVARKPHRIPRPRTRQEGS